jgi:cbb3-type cytochrome oxidase subunit 3
VHQIIGLVIFSAVFIQTGLGLSHHLIYMRAGTPTVMGKIHRFLGISIMLLGIANGFIGLHFSGNTLTPYGIVVAVMLVIFAALTFFVFRHNQRHVYKPEQQAFIPRADDESRAYEMSETPFASRGAIQTPRTPFFSMAKKWNDRTQNLRSERRENQMSKSGAKIQAESLYADTPADERTNPFKGKWEAAPLR